MRYENYILTEKTGGFRPVLGMVYIYWLLEPRNNSVRYVGKTLDPHTRFRHYLDAAVLGKDKHLPSTRWVAKLRAHGEYPIMHLEELVPADAWEPREKHWIAHYIAQGHHLLNILPGGGGTSGFTRPPEVRAKIASTLSGHVVSPDTREALRKSRAGQKAAPETRERLSTAMRERWAAMTAEERDAHVRAKRRPTWTPEMRAALAAKKLQTGPRPDGSLPGVRLNPKTGKWQAQVREDGRNKHLGSFLTQDEAAAARQAFLTK